MGASTQTLKCLKSSCLPQGHTADGFLKAHEHLLDLLPGHHGFDSFPQSWSLQTYVYKIRDALDSNQSFIQIRYDCLGVAGICLCSTQCFISNLCLKVSC